MYYPIGLCCLTLFYFVLNVGVFKWTKKRLRHYRKVGFAYDVMLTKPKNYVLICLGAFVGGFNGGVFGIGNSTCVIMTLLAMDV